MDLASARSSAQKWIIRVVAWGLVALVFGLVLYTFGTLNYVYSSGERVGFVQKISKRGWMCKPTKANSQW